MREWSSKRSVATKASQRWLPRGNSDWAGGCHAIATSGRLIDQWNNSGAGGERGKRARKYTVGLEGRILKTKRGPIDNRPQVGNLPHNCMSGVFITFEGPDGSGKSTQCRMLAGRLRQMEIPLLESAEPGGTPIGQKIRRILLDPENSELSATTELLLMFAARAQNVDQWILPALAEGKVVLSDRFTDSTIVFQGSARGLGWDIVRTVDKIACKGLVPDLTLCIDIETTTGLARAHARNRSNQGVRESRLDEQAIDFHQKARAAYHELARQEPARFRLIDGNAAPEVVAERVWQQVERLLQRFQIIQAV